jgi:cystathionine beta-synthase
MREHGMLLAAHTQVKLADVAASRTKEELILASPHDRVVDVIKRMREDAISQLPVVDDDQTLLGAVSEVDLLNHMLKVDHKHKPDETIEMMVNREVPRAHSKQLFDQVIPELMSAKMVILTDENNRPEGILTMIDALEYVTRKEMS